MKYTISISEQARIEGHTPDGMSPFSIHVVCESEYRFERWMGIFAPSGLFERLSDEMDALRIASFVSLGTIETLRQNKDQYTDEQTETAIMFIEMEQARIAAFEKFELDYLEMVLNAFRQDGEHFQWDWPSQHSLFDLTQRAQSELKRTALEHVVQGVRPECAEDQPPASGSKPLSM